jgi:hypothetical protein
MDAKPESRLEALKMLKEWSSLLLSLQAGLLTLLEIFAKPSQQTTSFTIFVIAFAISVVIAANVVGAIPSMIQRLGDEPVGDIYQMQNRWGLRLGLLAFGQHLFFVIGVASLAVYFLTSGAVTEIRPAN